MKRSRRSIVSLEREDGGVAEVVGAILLFAVVISLFTSFMVWYIPAETASNESHYEISTKNALGSFISDIHKGDLSQGSTLSENIPLGISGVAIFSASRDTQFSILPKSGSFNASLSLGITMGATNSSGASSVHYLNETYSVSGVMETSGNTQYVTAINYVMEDGALFQNYGDNQAPDTLGPMPLGIAGSAGQYSLNLGIYGLTGSSVTYSSSQSQVVNVKANTSQAYQYVNGTSAPFGGSQFVINSMALNSMNYTINGSLASAWDYGLFGLFNSSLSGYSSVIGIGSWNFSGEPFSASFNGKSVSVVNTGTVSLSSISTEFLVLEGI